MVVSFLSRDRVTPGTDGVCCVNQRVANMTDYYKGVKRNKNLNGFKRGKRGNMTTAAQNIRKTVLVRTRNCLIKSYIHIFLR